MITRRGLLAGAALIGSAGFFSTKAAARSASLDERFAALEEKVGGRLGVAVIDTGTGATAGRRLDERFAMCSTLKFLAVTAVLAAVDQGREALDRRIAMPTGGFLAWSPATEKHAGAEMALADICEAAMVQSDNTAANIILDSLGGPERLTAYIRTLGDEVTRSDRFELALNDVPPGDPRDTTTPKAMARNLQKVVLGEALSPASRDRMTRWLVGNKTGDNRIRAGFPAGWRIGDKTGTSKAATNDIAIVWPPASAPIIITAYFDAPGVPGNKREAALKEVGAIIAASVNA